MEQIKTEQYKKHLFDKKEILNNAIIQLKKEFIGIDHVIDQIANAITSWFFFPEMQDRPVIINLWGLTGIGKTSVIKRLTELLGYTEHYFRFDLGECTSRYFDIQDSFKDIYTNCDGAPFIIGLDEFQLARTINEEQEEIDRASIRAVWDLLDSGKFDIVNFDYNMSWFNKLIKKFDLALYKGVEVEKGIITANIEIYKETLSLHNKQEEKRGKKEKTFFISDGDLDTIFDMVDHLFIAKSDLRDKLNGMDGDQTVDYLICLYKASLKPKTVDCTKSLIFVMGNLDEVYTMSHNFNPDMSANEFHRQSTEITVTEVKQALLSRFRSEQIARLGNNHIIYPAFDEQSFYGIIRLELDKVKRKVADTYNIEMLFDTKVEQLIYEEGVYPTQGTRPLFTTVHQIVNTRLGKILNEIYLNGYEADSLRFTINDEASLKDNTALQIDFLKDNKVIHHIIDQQPLVLGKLRQEKRNDEQAIVAVHESGHAILSSVLMKTIPEVIFSVTADSNSDGFVLSRPEWNYISKKEIINRLAVLLGGFVAERIIFGEENVTIGSSSDLGKATRLATYAIYICGMGNTRAFFGNENMNNTPSVIFDNSSETVNVEAKELLLKAEELAEKTLKKQEKLLIKMADYLSDKRTLNKEQVKDFIRQYAIDFNLSEVIEDAECLFYRKHLKELAEKYN
jgi:cell division protease FtsH